MYKERYSLQHLWNQGVGGNLEDYHSESEQVKCMGYQYCCILHSSQKKYKLIVIAYSLMQKEQN